MARDTIFALSSGRLPAAIAVIRVSGPRAHAAGDALCGALPVAREAAVRTLRHPRSGDELDEALVLRFDAPASATAEDVIELHCHGSRAVANAVLSALAGIEGLRAAEPGEFTRRAFENGRIDLTEAEGLADLLEAETEAQRRAALRMAEGGLRRQIETWRRQVLALSAEAELAIDYVGEDDAAESAIAPGARALAEEVGQWLFRPRAERLKDGVRVVAAGPPNAGKSSLINAIAGADRAIVSEIAGTTRDAIEVPLAISGRPFVFVDTAGMRESADAIEAIGVGLAEREVDSADILLWLGDPDEAPAHKRIILIHAKCDLDGAAPTGSVAVSAVTGAGLNAIIEMIVLLSDDLLPAADSVALNDRQASALEDARDALLDAAAHDDPVLQAEGLRLARTAVNRLTGRAGVEDLLDALFGRFCLGK